MKTIKKLFFMGQIDRERWVLEKKNCVFVLRCQEMERQKERANDFLRKIDAWAGIPIVFFLGIFRYKDICQFQFKVSGCFALALSAMRCWHLLLSRT